MKPWESTFPSDERLETEWKRLSAKDRITRLELKHYPKVSAFDPNRELFRAVSQYYCEDGLCNKPSTQLERSVITANTKRVIDEIELDQGRRLSEGEEKKLGDETIEMVGIKSGLVLINQERLQKEVEGVINNNPSLVTRLEGRDLYTVMLKSVLFHAFTHGNADKSYFDITPIGVISTKSATFDKVGDGFVFSGRRLTGEPVYVLGADEAMTEYVAVFKGQKYRAIYRRFSLYSWTKDY